jgi:hypothetical protein
MRPGLARAAPPLKRKAGVHDAAPLRVDGGGRLRWKGRASPGNEPLIETLAAASFLSIWYWVLHAVVWSLACYRTLGVPLDMLHRARSAPEIAERVDLLAHLASARIGGVHDLFGVPIAAFAGFSLTVLWVIGFGLGIEAAQAAFVLLLPLAVIGYSKLRLALAVRGRGIEGAELVLALARRRVWHQFIAVLATLTALGLAVVSHVPRLPPV